MTTSISKTLTSDEQIFKDLVWSPAIKAGELALESAVPFFALPVINIVERGVIDQLSGWVFEQVVLLIDVTVIKLANIEHQEAYDKASLELKVIAVDKGINSDEFKIARDAARLALSKFTNIAA